MKHTILSLLLIINYTLIADQKIEMKLVPVKNVKGSLSINFLRYMRNIFNSEVFIETGTFLGESAFTAAKVFKKVETIELSQDLYEKSKKFLSEKENVTVHLGDSAEVLKTLLPEITDRIIFWLDGHYSGLHAGHQTALSENNPLLIELDNIKNANKNNAVIMIDDIRFCDPEIINNPDPIIGGYPTMETICKKLYEINSNYRIVVMGDVLIAYPNRKNLYPSKVLNACTYSRLYNTDSKQDLSILHFEDVISKAIGIEKKAIEILSNTFGSDLHCLNFGVAKHYMLWHSLILQNKGEINKCRKKLHHLKKINFNHWRINYYLDNLKKNNNK